MAERGFDNDDLRAAVSAGILTEAQASRVIALAEQRAARRLEIAGEDEPFELFRGFAEIFVSVGLILLMVGIVGVSALMGHPLPVLVTSLALTWVLALYFTRARRMTLPSIVLSIGFALALGATIAYFLLRNLNLDSRFVPNAMTLGGLQIAGLLVWYRVFKVPFTMFLVGLTALWMIFVLTARVMPGVQSLSLTDIFDLRQSSGLALGSLVFGLLAFVAAMYFDTRDPHRLGRRAASGFWLHLLAAPALVNTAAMTFYNMGPGQGYLMLAVALGLIGLLALVIDRRSFLTAGLGYMAFLIALVARANGQGLSWAGVILVLGLTITVIGAFWTQMRAVVMRALPDFPGKDRLPPYQEKA
ncbi:MAG: hypothetical protein ACOY5U_00170 [Pseudomonadota bacterium]